MRNQSLIRSLGIIRRLESPIGSTIAELAEDAGVTTRTIRRDLEAIQSAGVPLIDEVDTESRRRWRVYR